MSPLAILGTLRHAGGFPFAAAHLILLGVTVWISRRELPRYAGWLPLAAIPFLYTELPVLIAGFGGSLHDSTLQRLELAIFGASPAAVWAGKAPWMALSELFHFGYVAYYPLIYVPPLVAYLRRQDEVFDRTAAALMAVFGVCFVIFAVYPVVGPRYLWPAPRGIPDGPLRRLALGIVGAGSAKGTAFPSSHVAVSVVQTAITLRWQPRLGVWALVATVLLTAGAVYGGFHYAVDALAGVAVGLVIAGFQLSRT